MIMKHITEWAELSANLQSQFLLDGEIQLEKWLIDGANVAINEKLYTDQTIDLYLQSIANRENGSYGRTDHYLYELLDRHDISKKSCAIMGSVSPWYEAIALHYGAKPTTFEYNTFVPKSSRLKINDITKKTSKQFDIGFSISTFEHDGLGRYGDPINPNGDKKAMSDMKKLLKPGGLLFIAVPIGMDKIVWNAHRIYGKIRLPLLFRNWNIIDSAGYEEERCEINTGKSGTYQPVFVLQNT
jgi:SAM-dependent methyltransferase